MSKEHQDIWLTLEQIVNGAQINRKACYMSSPVQENMFLTEVDVEQVFDIPRNVKNGEKITIYSVNGNYIDFVTVHYIEHDDYQIDGLDLYKEEMVPSSMLRKGGQLEVSTLHGKLSINIPPKTADSHFIEVPGYGLTERDNGQSGLLYIRVRRQSATLPIGFMAAAVLAIATVSWLILDISMHEKSLALASMPASGPVITIPKKVQRTNDVAKNTSDKLSECAPESSQSSQGKSL